MFHFLHQEKLYIHLMYPNALNLQKWKDTIFPKNDMVYVYIDNQSLKIPLIHNLHDLLNHQAQYSTLQIHH